jgi:hypothetical protein
VHRAPVWYAHTTARPSGACCKSDVHIRPTLTPAINEGCTRSLRIKNRPLYVLYRTNNLCILHRFPVVLITRLTSPVCTVQQASCCDQPSVPCCHELLTDQVIAGSDYLVITLPSNPIPYNYYLYNYPDYLVITCTKSSDLTVRWLYSIH